MSTSQIFISNPWTDNSLLPKDSLAVEKSTRDEDFKERVSKIATVELREDEATRKQCLEQLREWIKQNQDLENCFTDSNFLLRFLRVKKFSLPMAQQTLLKYLNFRKRFMSFMFNMDYLDGGVNQLFSNGYIVASPIRDSNGRRVIIYNLNQFDLKKFTNIDMARAHAITYETVLEDEDNQILGINHVGDLNGASPAFLTLFSITEFATIIRWGEQSMPMRHKEVNLVNLPSSLKYVYDFAQSNVRNQKLKERFRIHSSLAELQKHVPKESLPLEMGGIMPLKDMIQLWREELAAKRERLLQYDNMNLLSDRGIIRSRKAPAQDDTGTGSLPGSFRKLEVD